jgi:hypothetical protein
LGFYCVILGPAGRWRRAGNRVRALAGQCPLDRAQRRPERLRAGRG